MTHEEAIKELEWVKERGFVADLGIAGTDRIIDACDLAIKALEKQTPKKPKDGKYAGATVCPVCDNEFGYNTGFEYCEKCGQRLDWSDNE